VIFFNSGSAPQQHQAGLPKVPKRASGVLASELDVQAFGLGNNGRNDLPGLPPEVCLTEDALPKVVLLHSTPPSSGLAKGVARRRGSVAVIASVRVDGSGKAVFLIG
jgi:hypothetical protein